MKKTKLKKIALLPAGFSAAASGVAVAEEAKAKFTAPELVNELRRIRQKPLNINVVCAMCYEMAVLPVEIDFHCDICNQDYKLERLSEAGGMVERLPYIKRSLALMPYKIKMNTAALCPVCGKTQEKKLNFDVECFNCGKKFSWDIKKADELYKLEWLYLKPPFIEIDGTHLGFGWDKDKQAAGIREGGDYISDRVFCPACRIKLDLGTPVKNEELKKP